MGRPLGAGRRGGLTLTQVRENGDLHLAPVCKGFHGLQCPRHGARVDGGQPERVQLLRKLARSAPSSVAEGPIVVAVLPAGPSYGLGMAHKDHVEAAEPGQAGRRLLHEGAV